MAAEELTERDTAVAADVPGHELAVGEVTDVRAGRWADVTGVVTGLVAARRQVGRHVGSFGLSR